MRKSCWTLLTHPGRCTAKQQHSSFRATRRYMAPSPCITMNPVQGSPSQDDKQLHQKEETEEEEAKPKDMTTDKGYKHQRSSLPFSVESLISKKTTCRTAFSPSDLALVLPKPVAAEGDAQFSPRTLYAETKVSTEGSQGVSCSNDERFPTSNFPTPPRKFVLLLFWEFYTLQQCAPSTPLRKIWMRCCVANFNWLVLYILFNCYMLCRWA